MTRGRVVCNRVVRPSGRHRDACPERGLQRRASDSDSEISVLSVDSEGARDIASRPGGRPPRLRPSSASGAGAGDGARGGGGHTGANGRLDRIIYSYSFGDGPDVVGELAGALEAHIFEERLGAVAQ